MAIQQKSRTFVPYKTKEAMKQFDDEKMKWKVLTSETVLSRPWLHARRDKVQLPNGKIFDEYYVLHYPTWINVIAETSDGRLILERQYRHAIGKMSTEICAGCAEAGETPLQAAQRELQEETGYSGGEWTELLCLAPNSSTMDNYCHCFYAQGIEKVSEQHLDETEDIHVFFETKEEVFARLQQGEFLQAMMVAPLWKFFALYTDLLRGGISQK